MKKFHSKFFISLSFGLLCEVVDHIFPLLAQEEGEEFPGSDTLERCEFWNRELPDAATAEKDPHPAETS